MEEVAVERVENVSSFVREVIRIITHSHLDNANVFMVGHFLVILILIDLFLVALISNRLGTQKMYPGILPRYLKQAS